MLPPKITNDRAAIDRARRGAYAVPLAHVLARPNERGDLHLDQMHAPQPWRDVLLMVLAAVVCYLAIIGVGALVSP